MTRTASRQSGFTLIEVLLAVAITATVMLTVGTTFHVMLDARDTVDDLSESTEAGPRLLNLIERDLRGIWTFNVHNNAVFRGRDMDIGGRDADRMDFLTTTDAVGYVLDTNNVPRKPTLCEVGYWFKPNPRFRELFEMWRREDPMVDGDLITQGSFQLVHDRIKSFKVTYFETLGYEAEPKYEWDSTAEDKLPARIKIEFTLERRRSNRADSEIEDFEGAEKTYVRHIVFDERMQNILVGGRARVPVPPIAPTAEASGPEGPAGSGGPGGPAGAGVAGGRGTATTQTVSGPMRGPGNRNTTEMGPGATPPRGQGGRGQPPQGLPPGFNLGDLLRGAGGSGGSGGLGGLFGGGAGGRR